MHETYLNFIRARVEAAVGAARAASGISRRGLKGEVREILIRDLLRPLLPADLGVGTGEIISHTNQTSSQIDVVLYDRRILPPVLFQEATGLFPIESVLYTIEVKSKLTTSELRWAHDAAGALENFCYAPGHYDPGGVPRHHQVTKVVPTVIALDTDLTPGGMNEIERYDSLRAADVPHLKAICVVGRGYWYWHGDRWKTWPGEYPYAELVSFVGS